MTHRLSAKPADTTVWALIFHHLHTVFLAELEAQEPNWPACCWPLIRPALLVLCRGLALALILASKPGGRLLLGRWLAFRCAAQRLRADFRDC